MKTTSRKLAYIVCVAPTSKSDFMEKFRRLVATNFHNYFIPFSAFYLIFEFLFFHLLHLIFLKRVFFFFFFFYIKIIFMYYSFILSNKITKKNKKSKKYIYVNICLLF